MQKRKELLDRLSRKLGKTATEDTVIALKPAYYYCWPQFVWVREQSNEALRKVLESQGA